jgi:long-chain acyl-CoA synthetase
VKNLYDFYKNRCERYASKKLFDRKVSYADAFEYACDRAEFLQKQGLKKGDVVAIIGASSYEWCITYMAITSAGCIGFPIDVNLPAADTAAIMMFAGVKAVFTDEEHAAKGAGYTQYSLYLTDDMGDRLNFVPPNMERTDYAAFFSTSGTTGTPKLAIMTHHNVMMTPISNSESVLESNDHFLSVLPLFHVYAFMANFLGPFAIGGTIVFLRSLKGPDIVRALSEDSFTIFSAAPQLWELFLDAILVKAKSQSALKYKILIFFLETGPFLRTIGLGFLVNKVFSPIRNIFGSKIRFFLSGGAPLKVKYYNYYRAIGYYIIEGYGLTETSGPIMLSSVASEVGKKYKPGTVGKVIPGNFITIKNVNEDGIGEVWLKGDFVFAGYYKNDEATKDVFDSQGYFNTGDIGRIDKHGDLYLTGRKKNTIVLDSGKNVYPDEIEAHIKKSSYIADVAVFGKQIDERETVCAVIVPVVKNAYSFSDIKKEIDSLNSMLPSYKRVGKLAISVDPLPKNSARKTLLNDVKKAFDKGAYLTDADSIAKSHILMVAKSHVEENILAILKKRFKSETLYANQLLFDMGIDSLTLIDLIVLLEEELKISTDEKKMRSIETIEQLMTYLLECPEKKGISLDDQILKSAIRTKSKYFPNPINWLFVFKIKMLSRLFWKLKVIHGERLQESNVIIAANHASYIDILWLLAVLPAGTMKKICITGKSEVSFLRFIFPGAPVVFIEREGNVIPALKASADLLRSGKSLIIFPEGTRSSNGKLGEFKSGAAYLAKNLNKKIVPVHIIGAYHAMPKGKKMPRFFSGTKGFVVVGEPLDPKQYASVDELNAALKITIASLNENS